MVSLALSGEQQAMIDTVGGALADRGARSAAAVLQDLGIEALLGEGGSLLDAALVAEAAGREGIQATIYGGTSEVQRSVIAETALGLPRSR